MIGYVRHRALPLSDPTASAFSGCHVALLAVSGAGCGFGGALLTAGHGGNAALGLLENAKDWFLGEPTLCLPAFPSGSGRLSTCSWQGGGA